MCLCVHVCRRTLGIFILIVSEKSNFDNFLLLLNSRLLSSHRGLTLYTVTCDKAVFAVITVMTVCLPLSKLCDKSQTKNNIWHGRSRRGEGNCMCVCVCVQKWRGSVPAAVERVRVYCSRTDQGIKFHTSMKGFTLLTHNIRGKTH